jgi:putative mycofactocin binding protein MftB
LTGLPLDGRFELAPDVGLRDERFGALAYHYGNRRLTFLNDRRLVDAVRRLAAADSLAAALGAADVPVAQQPAFAVALGRLADAGVIRPRDAR